jgi:NAD(P)-dependent dehydrogenase (short-subunit alcohol dehydrogenase family)
MKTVLVIGGSSGIGKSIVDQLSLEGHLVYSSYFENERSSSQSIQYFHHNALEDNDFDLLPEQLDGLVYCPGSINLMPFKRISPEAFAQDFDLQVLGAIRIIQKILPRLKVSGNASIVLFSTVAVQQGFNYHAQVATSKGALEGLTKSLAAEFAPYIRVNAIAPSLTDTALVSKLLNSDQKRMANAERHPLKRIGHVDDIANAACFLLSTNSSWITGQILHVDGGKSSISC